MGAGEIAHMDVVAHAGSIGRAVIVAVDAHAVALAGGSLGGDLDQMRRSRRRLARAQARIGAATLK